MGHFVTSKTSSRQGNTISQEKQQWRNCHTEKNSFCCFGAEATPLVSFTLPWIEVRSRALRPFYKANKSTIQKIILEKSTLVKILFQAGWRELVISVRQVNILKLITTRQWKNRKSFKFNLITWTSANHYTHLQPADTTLKKIPPSLTTLVSVFNSTRIKLVTL